MIYSYFFWKIFDKMKKENNTNYCNYYNNNNYYYSDSDSTLLSFHRAKALVQRNVDLHLTRECKEAVYQK